jgi:predicted outer membrane lipoprotein
MYPLPAHYDRTQYTSTRLLDVHASCAFGFVNAMDLEWSVYEATTYEAAIVWREQHVAVYFPFRDKEGSLHSERAQQPKLMAREEAISFSRPRWGAFVHVGECLPDFAVVPEMPALAVVPRDVQWIMDTGSGHDLLPAELVGHNPPDRISISPVTLRTANGRVTVTSSVPVNVPVLQECVTPLINRVRDEVFQLAGLVPAVGDARVHVLALRPQFDFSAKMFGQPVEPVNW